MTAQDTGPMRGWLALLCASRLLQAMIVTAYSGVLPFLMADWQLTAAQAGSVQSAWHVGYMSSLFAVGLLADRYGPHRIFLAGSAVSAMAALAFAVFARDHLSAVLLYGLAGLCAGASYTPGLQLLARNTEPAVRGRAMGLFIGSASMGYALSLAVVAVCSHLQHWRLGLLIAAAGTAAGALLTVQALRRMRPAMAFVAGTPGIPGMPREGPWQSLAATVRDKPAMAGNWAYAFHCWELMALWAWLPAYLVASSGAGTSWQGAGIALAALAHLVSVFGSVAGGAASDRLGRARVMMIATVASLCMSFSFGWMWTWPLWLLAAAAAVYNLLAIADSSVYSTALADVVAPHRLGVAYSVRSVMGFGAGALSPWVFGLALDWGQTRFGLGSTHGWVAAWSSVGLGALLGPLMIARFSRLHRARALAQ
ncbi:MULTISPECIES: MFS transporter [unclassified Variovorax]|uniref:MFS transporter n=1 Tax=unclassified Variovorax TaxID=663243 RepID=UPI0008B85EE4|nr:MULTISPECIES: MFS transporter [unclassified Variovorax]SEJ16470.1 Sugar phosphate permease [Variovorax sp. OK202]SFC07295.1 Sugar phosphate permease [Variovorax sp. OK212]